MWRLQSSDAHAAISLGYEELHAFLSEIPQFTQRFVRSAGQRERLGCGPAQRDQSAPKGEATFIVAAHQSVGFESGGQPMGRGPGHPGDSNQLRKRTGRLLQGVEQNNGLVEDAHTA
jgi:hypothetical protein